jgi:hypothetical protein
MAKRRNFTDQFEAEVALEALRGDKTVQEIAATRQLHVAPEPGQHVEASGHRGHGSWSSTSRLKIGCL